MELIEGWVLCGKTNSNRSFVRWACLWLIVKSRVTCWPKKRFLNRPTVLVPSMNKFSKAPLIPMKNVNRSLWLADCLFSLKEIDAFEWQVKFTTRSFYDARWTFRPKTTASNFLHLWKLSFESKASILMSHRRVEIKWLAKHKKVFYGRFVTQQASKQQQHHRAVAVAS